MKNRLCKLLFVILLIKNIRCGVSGGLRREKRFLSALFGDSEETTTQSTIRVYKVPIGLKEHFLKTFSNFQEVLNAVPENRRVLYQRPLYPQFLQVPNKEAQNFMEPPPVVQQEENFNELPNSYNVDENSVKEPHPSALNYFESFSNTFGNPPNIPPQVRRHVIPGLITIPLSRGFPQQEVTVPQTPQILQKSDEAEAQEENSWDLGFETLSEEMKNFYHTKEFKDLIDEYNVTIDIAKLPEVDLVTAFLGTTNVEDTISTIREIANTTDGLVMIRQFLEPESNGLEQLFGPAEDNNQLFQPLPPINFQPIPTISTPKKKEKSLSMWNPNNWFVAETNDITTIAPAEIKTPAPQESFWDTITGLFASNVREEAFTNQPVIRKSPENPPQMQPTIPPENIPSESTTQASTSTPVQISLSTTKAPQSPVHINNDIDFENIFFQSPILVYNDSELEGNNFEISGGGVRQVRKSFSELSGPQRISDFDFVPGKVHKANPEAIQSLIKTSEVIAGNERKEKSVVDVMPSNSSKARNLRVEIVSQAESTQVPQEI